MKRSRRLDYSSLADALVQRGLVDPQRISLALQTSTQSQIPFPEFLIIDGLISDWDLSLVACDLFNLPFLPVDFYRPSPEAREGLDEDFLRANRLVPLDRYGTLLTVCMPAIVTADVISSLAAKTDTRVLPVVGTVLSNNTWLEENMPVDVAPALPEQAGPGGNGWGNIFDQGDAAVLMELGGPEDELSGLAAADDSHDTHDTLAALEQDLGEELAILPAEPDDPELDVAGGVEEAEETASLLSPEAAAIADEIQPTSSAPDEGESNVPLLNGDTPQA